MSENDYRSQNRPSRRSVSTERRAVGNVRPRATGADGRTRQASGSGSGYRTSYRETVDHGERVGSRQGSGEYSTRRSESYARRAPVQDDYAEEGYAPSQRRSSTRTRTSARSEAAAGGGSVVGSIAEGAKSAFQRVMDLLPESDWVRRGILIVAALIVVLLLFNLVSCIAGAISGPAQSQSSQSASASSASASASAASASATSAATTGVSSPWTEDGTFSTGDATLDAYIKSLCDQYSTQGGTFDSNAYDTYIYVSRTDYIERANNQSPWGPNWDVEYAKQYFEEGNSGNCFNFAAVVEYVLKYFGYSDAEAEPCVVGLESGDWGDHGLVFVTNKVDGKRCLIDSSLSANGWMLDADSYSYDIRNIDQNSTIQGNVDVLGDNDTPTPIPPGELTEPEPSASAQAADADADENAADGEEDPVYIEETYDDEEYYDDGTYDESGEEEYYDEGEYEGDYEEEYDESEEY